MDPFSVLARHLATQGVRYLVIGVWGANYYAGSGATVFTTEDRDLFLPLDPDNLVRCWEACSAAGLDLRSGTEPLNSPRDRWLAERRAFGVEGVEVSVARLLHIVSSTHAANRLKDRLFLATHREALQDLLKRE